MIDPAYRVLGARIRRARSAARLSPEVLAELVDLPTTTIYQTEAGCFVLPLHIIYPIAVACGCEASVILPTSREVRKAALTRAKGAKNDA
jgi:DNA-binding XRE family transcriptional regulator